MSWSIEVLDNTAHISNECATDLADLDDYDTITTYNNKLVFNYDDGEHMDYLWRENVQGVFLKHKVNGDVTFGSLQGDNSGSFWGYRFKDGELTRLKGSVVWAADAR